MEEPTKEQKLERNQKLHTALKDNNGKECRGAWKKHCDESPGKPGYFTRCCMEVALDVMKEEQPDATRRVSHVSAYFGWATSGKHYQPYFGTPGNKGAYDFIQVNDKLQLSHSDIADLLQIHYIDPLLTDVPGPAATALHLLQKPPTPPNEGTSPTP
jgi:hypothetical protein